MGGPSRTKKLIIITEKKSYPLPTSRTLLLSSQVSGLSEVWQGHGLQNREFWGKEVTTWSKARLGRAGSAIATPSSQRGWRESGAARSFNWYFSHLSGLHVNYYLVWVQFLVSCGCGSRLLSLRLRISEQVFFFGGGSWFERMIEVFIWWNNKKKEKLMFIRHHLILC